MSESFFNKVAGLRLTSCFPVNFVKFVRTPILKNTSGLLLLPFHALYSEVVQIDKKEILALLDLGMISSKGTPKNVFH